MFDNTKQYNIYLMNDDLFVYRNISSWISFIWTKRYCDTGEFELVVPYTIDLYNDLPMDTFLYTDWLWEGTSRQVMMIEHRSLRSTEDQGLIIVISGRSVESVLMRRIVLDRFMWFAGIDHINASLHEGVRNLLTRNIFEATSGFNPAPSRTWNQLVWQSSSDPDVHSIVHEMQYRGENLFDCVVEILRTHNLGFEIGYSPENKRFYFQIYKGRNLSNDVIFSPAWDNLLNSSLYETDEPWRNGVLVLGGDGDGLDRDANYVSLYNLSGRKLREMTVDAHDIRREFTDSAGNQHLLSDEHFYTLLMNQGIVTLNENRQIIMFDGEAIMLDGQFRLGRDFKIGDIVRIEAGPEYGAYARVEELVFSVDVNGATIVPTFTFIQDQM